ncbi:hypothetical protein N824_01860 [Pedobacter sp. V48]|nr:hypothetical protein N824_01860 [Pedobacter sp. V48]
MFVVLFDLIMPDDIDRGSYLLLAVDFTRKMNYSLKYLSYQPAGMRHIRTKSIFMFKRIFDRL